MLAQKDVNSQFFAGRIPAPYEWQKKESKTLRSLGLIGNMKYRKRHGDVRGCVYALG